MTVFPEANEASIMNGGELATLEGALYLLMLILRTPSEEETFRT